MNKPTRSIEAIEELSLLEGLGGETLTGGRAIGRALVENGVTDLFGVHGYINTAIDEACRLGANMYHFRHEQSAGFAADAYARTLRKPGVFFASASAGMANCLSALSQGIGALSPMVLLVGQHGTAGDHLELLQEGYAAEAFKTVAKWTHRCVDREMNAYWVRKALMDCMSYPHGPVVLEFPLNNLWDAGSEPQRKYIPVSKMPSVPSSQGNPADIAAAAKLLLAAKNPMLIAGDGLYWSDGMAEYRELAELMNIPAGARRTARGAIPEDHDLAYTASIRGALFKETDLVCMVGMRMGELESWFEPPDWPRGDVKYIQINETPEEIWYALPTETSIAGSSKLVLRQLIDKLKTDVGGNKPARPDWLATLNAARKKAQDKRNAASEKHAKESEVIHTFTLAEAIADTVEPDATIIYDSYSGSLYLTDAITAKFPGQVLDSGPRVALGQGIGMCFGANIARPGKQVITLIGDGGFGLSGMDMETMLRYDQPAVVVLLNNSSWGGKALFQHDFHPNLDSWDMIPGIRYDKMFEALGCHTEHVDKAEDLRPALRRALESGKPALVNVVADTDSPRISAAWLRLKTGDIHGRGIADMTDTVRQLYAQLSPMEAIRLQKMCADNGLKVSLEFVAELTGNSKEDVEELAARTGYRY